MKKVTVVAKDPGTKKEGQAVVNFGDTAEESIKMFGAEALNSNALANAKVTIQGGIRRMLKAGKSPAEIQKVYDGWKLGVAIARVGGDPVTATLNKADSMDKKELQDLIAKLKAKVS